MGQYLRGCERHSPGEVAVGVSGRTECRRLTRVSELGARFAAVGPSLVAEWLGVTMREHFFEGPSSDNLAHETWEWLALIDAVDGADSRFTMLELGAGVGRWTVNAAAALRRYRPGRLRHRLVAVEAEPTHFQWLRQHTRDNGLRRWSRQGSCRLVNAAVSGSPGRQLFYVGDPSGWYGQGLVRPYNMGSAGKVATVSVKTIALSSLLRRFEHVDLIDADVQGAELEVFAEALPYLGRVDRVYVETHSETVHRELAALLAGAGLEPVVEVPLGARRETPFGPGNFDGGVLDCRRQ